MNAQPDFTWVFNPPPEPALVINWLEPTVGIVCAIVLFVAIGHGLVQSVTRWWHR